jgi:diguanylate cyclase
MRIDLSQIVEALGQGIFVVDAEGRVVYWNRTLAFASGIEMERAVGSSIFELFPELERTSFRRDLKSVLSFGNFAYFSQKLHGRLISLPAPPGSPPGFRYMEQNCVMGPMRTEGRIAYAYVIIEDVTDTVDRERRLDALAMKDVLTSAFNRRFFERRLDEEITRSGRYRRSLALVMLDIDHFKKVNDTYGHLFGDQALRAVVEAWTSGLRASDIVARYGGEEFCVLLPEAGREKALPLAERLRTSAAAAEIRCGELRGRITVSGGVAFLREGDSPEDLLKRADDALYRAKDRGRDRIEEEA